MNNTIVDLVASLKLIGEEAMEKILMEIKVYMDLQNEKIKALEARIETLEQNN